METERRSTMSSLKGQLSNMESSVKSMKTAVVVGSVLTVACLAAVFGVTILANEVSKETKVANGSLVTKTGSSVRVAVGEYASLAEAARRELIQPGSTVTIPLNNGKMALNVDAVVYTEDGVVISGSHFAIMATYTGAKASIVVDSDFAEMYKDLLEGEDITEIKKDETTEEKTTEEEKSLDWYAIRYRYSAYTNHYIPYNCRYTCSNSCKYCLWRQKYTSGSWIYMCNFSIGRCTGTLRVRVYRWSFAGRCEEYKSRCRPGFKFSGKILWKVLKVIQVVGGCVLGTLKAGGNSGSLAAGKLGDAVWYMGAKYGSGTLVKIGSALSGPWGKVAVCAGQIAILAAKGDLKKMFSSSHRFKDSKEAIKWSGSK